MGPCRCPRPDHLISAKNPLTIDLDATLVTAHSEKEHAAPTYKRGFGHHPLAAFLDHGQTGTGEPLALQLRPGNAGSNTAADHLTVIAEALRQLPFPTAGRVGHKVLIRTDGAGGTHEVVEYLSKRALSYSLGFGLTTTMVARLSLIPDQVWTPAYDAEEAPREGAWVAELTGLLDLTAWPAGMRVIVRKERPHPGAQLRFTDADGLRLTAFITNTRGRQLAPADHPTDLGKATMPNTRKDTQNRHRSTRQATTSAPRKIEASLGGAQTPPRHSFG